MVIGSGNKCGNIHKTCITKVGPSSYCKRESNTCQGAPHVKCGCDQKGPAVAASKKEKSAGKRSGSTPVIPKARSVDGSKPSGHKPTKSTGQKRKSEDSPKPRSTIQEPSHPRKAMKAKEGASHRSTEPVVASAPRMSASRSGSNDGIFLWLEWPSMRSSEWNTFFANVLNFMRSNCGGFKVSRIIARVLSPNFQSNRGRLWQVGTDSVFFKSFLSKVPAGTEIMIYPYMLESTPEVWMADMDTPTGLEGVYKYVSEWNKLLASERPEIKISGIVTDYEEHEGFESDLPSISSYRYQYSTPGQPRLRFGAAMGFDQPRRAASISSNIDDVYLEMYDFYVQGSKPAVLFEQGKLKNDIEATLQRLDDDVWYRYMRYYDHGNLHFMWSLQAKSSSSCLYPIAGRKCGTKDDLGVWDAPKAAEFIDTVKARYPNMNNKLHGFYEFSYLPESWMQC
jgi:hypothetical protein